MSFRPARSRTFPRFFQALATDFGTRVPHIFSTTGRASARGDPLAAAADRERPSARSWSAMATPPSSRRMTAIGWSRRPTTRRTPSPSSIPTTSNIGSPRASSFTRGRSPHGPPRAAMSPTSGRPKWRRSAMNIGSLSPRGRRRTRWPSALREAPIPLGPWVDNGEPLITGKPLNTTGLGLDRQSRR